MVPQQPPTILSSIQKYIYCTVYTSVQQLVRFYCVLVCVCVFYIIVVLCPQSIYLITIPIYSAHVQYIYFNFKISIFVLMGLIPRNQLENCLISVKLFIRYIYGESYYLLGTPFSYCYSLTMIFIVNAKNKIKPIFNVFQECCKISCSKIALQLTIH